MIIFSRQVFCAVCDTAPAEFGCAYVGCNLALCAGCVVRDEGSLYCSLICVAQDITHQVRALHRRHRHREGVA